MSPWRSIKRNLALIIFIFSLSLLSGCQANLEWFIRNLSDKEVVLTLHYETKVIQYRDPFIPLKTKYIDYKKEIVKINYETSNTLKDSLQVTAIDPSTYQIIIPAQSTIELTYIIPTDYGYRSNVVAVFNQNGNIYSINSLNIFDKYSQFKTTGTFTLKNLVYFDYLENM